MAVLYRTRFGGLAVTAALFTAVFLAAGFTFTPLTATRKIFLAALAAPALGLILDAALKPGRISALALGAVLAAAAAAVALWIFWPLLAQRAAGEAWQKGLAIAVAAAFAVGFSQAALASDGVRSGSAALALGLGVGVASILAASATYGTYGIAAGAGAGSYLLFQMIRGKRAPAGATLTLAAALPCMLLATGAMMLAQLPWHSLLVLALVPLGARMPLPARAPVWLQAVLLSLCCFIIAAIACYLAWHA